MASSKVPAVVSTNWLRHQLSTARHNVTLLDSSWTPQKSDENNDHTDYVKEHIPGAVFFDLDRCIRPTPMLPRNLPEVTCFRDYARSLGVSKDSHLVIYDRSRIYSSTRAWWTFRVFGHDHVSVLDGGLIKWKIDSFPTESGDQRDVEEGDFEVRMRKTYLADYDDVVNIVKTKSRQIVDARRKEHYLGQMDEPSKYSVKSLDRMNQPVPCDMHRGHIPGSRHLHKNDVLDPDTMCFLDKEQLLKLFKTRGIDVTKPMTSLCYGGYSASLINMAALICGQDDTALYYGSWTEWGQRAPAELVQKCTSESHDPVT